MPKKPTTNSKALAANERKAAAQAEKDAKAAAAKEAEEASDWSKGAKSKQKQQDAEQKRLQALAAKKEREAMLEAEEREIGKAKAVKVATSSASSSMKRLNSNGSMNMGEGKKAQKKEDAIESYLSGEGKQVDEFEASGLDAAIDLMSIATKSPSKADAADKLDRHPERRMKSAWAMFEEKNMPILKEENPTLRQSQLKERLQKMWKKSPENPMNQVSLRFDASKEEEREFIASRNEEKLQAFRKK